MRQLFFIVLTICITYLLWQIIQLSVRTVQNNAHAQAYIDCAKQVKLKVMDKDSTELMDACLLRNGYNDKF